MEVARLEFSVLYMPPSEHVGHCVGSALAVSMESEAVFDPVERYGAQQENRAEDMAYHRNDAARVGSLSRHFIRLGCVPMDGSTISNFSS